MYLLRRLFFFTFNLIWKSFGLFLRRKDYRHQDVSVVTIVYPPSLGLGDMLMLSPLVSKVEDKFPSAKVFIRTNLPDFIEYKKAKVLKDNSIESDLVIFLAPSLSNLFISMSSRYFVGYFLSDMFVSNIPYDFSYTIQSECHYFDRALPILRLLNCDRKDLEYASIKVDEVATSLPNKFLCFSPFVNWSVRQYPASKYVDILSRICQELELDVVVIGGASQDELEFNAAFSRRLVAEAPSVSVYNFTGRLSLAQTASILKKSVFFLGNDSGPAHLSYSLAPFSFVIFGAIAPQTRIPLSSVVDGRIFTFDSGKSCYKFPCFNGHIEPRCDRNNACLNEIEPELIISTIYEKIRRDKF